MKQWSYDMTCKEIIIFLVLPYPPKRTAYRFVGTATQTLLQEHKRTVYISLLTSGGLNNLADIDKQATEMMFRLVEQMADKEGVTEQPK